MQLNAAVDLELGLASCVVCILSMTTTPQTVFALPFLILVLMCADLKGESQSNWCQFHGWDKRRILIYFLSTCQNTL